jgi:DNA-binding SARP family transcriptional activator
MESSGFIAERPPRIPGHARHRSGLHVNLLKSFCLTNHSGPVSLPLSAQRLVAFLALSDQPVSRAHVAAVLWREYPDERASANLRSALWRLRRPGLTVVETRGDQIGLASDVTVDLREAVARAWRLLAGTTDVDDPHDDSAFVWDVLPEWYEDWLLLERERFKQLRLHALETLAERLANTGRFAQSIDAALAAVQVDPLRETAHVALIKAYVAEGNPSQAIQQYRRYCDVLHRELGLQPLASIADLLPGIEKRTGSSSPRETTNRW